MEIDKYFILRWYDGDLDDGNAEEEAKGARNVELEVGVALRPIGLLLAMVLEPQEHRVEFLRRSAVQTRVLARQQI